LYKSLKVTNESYYYLLYILDGYNYNKFASGTSGNTLFTYYTNNYIVSYGFPYNAGYGGNIPNKN